MTVSLEQQVQSTQFSDEVIGELLQRQAAIEEKIKKLDSINDGAVSDRKEDLVDVEARIQTLQDEYDTCLNEPPIVDSDGNRYAWIRKQDRSDSPKYSFTPIEVVSSSTLLERNGIIFATDEQERRSPFAPEMVTYDEFGSLIRILRIVGKDEGQKVKAELEEPKARAKELRIELKEITNSRDQINGELAQINAAYQERFSDYNTQLNRVGLLTHPSELPLQVQRVDMYKTDLNTVHTLSQGGQPVFRYDGENVSCISSKGRKSEFAMDSFASRRILGGEEWEALQELAPFSQGIFVNRFGHPIGGEHARQSKALFDLVSSGSRIYPTSFEGTTVPNMLQDFS